MLKVESIGRSFQMQPGEWRNRPEHEVAVGRHLPPSSHRVADFTAHFHSRFRLDRVGSSGRILSLPTAHHRLNYIHPFPDGNGRVSRLMTHAMAHHAGIGAAGLWSVSRGLARGLNSRSEYPAMMDMADMPRQGDRDGRGNLSVAALTRFSEWFLDVCLDQVRSDLYDLSNLGRRLSTYVDRHERLSAEAAPFLRAVLLRGEVARGDAASVMALPERSARRVLGSLIDEGLLGSQTPKTPVIPAV